MMQHLASTTMMVVMILSKRVMIVQTWVPTLMKAILLQSRSETRCLQPSRALYLHPPQPLHLASPAKAAHLARAPERVLAHHLAHRLQGLLHQPAAAVVPAAAAAAVAAVAVAVAVVA